MRTKLRPIDQVEIQHQLNMIDMGLVNAGTLISSMKHICRGVYMQEHVKAIEDDLNTIKNGVSAICDVLNLPRNTES